MSHGYSNRQSHASLEVQTHISDNSLQIAWHNLASMAIEHVNHHAETARAMYATGAKLYFGVRDTNAGSTVAEDIAGNDAKTRIEVIKLDLGSLASVREAASDFLAKTDKLNILINNAGSTFLCSTFHDCINPWNIGRVLLLCMNSLQYACSVESFRLLISYQSHVLIMEM